MRLKRQDLYDHGIQSVYISQALLTLRRALSDLGTDLQTQDWVTGPQFGIVDIALISYFDRLQRLGMEGFWKEVPQMAAWLARMQDRTSYKIEVLDKVSPDSANKMRETGQKSWPELEAMWLKQS